VKHAFYAAALLWLAAFMDVRFATASTDAPPRQGDGIFTPKIAPVAPIDKTGRPKTVEVRRSEPSFTQSMIAGSPTGDSYVIDFPTGDAGGPCIYSGTGRYLIDSNGTLTFQILADCGKLRRGYSYLICRLDASLRCSESPWWYFRERTYVITNEGVTVNGSTVYPWQDTSEAPQQLQKMSDQIKAMNARFKAVSSSNTMHGRTISCRDFHPETKSYEIYDFPLFCLVRSVCSGMPNVDSVRDGDPLDWSSPAGNYVREKGKLSDVSHWECWLRTQ
jgi:hypothetical protein